MKITVKYFGRLAEVTGTPEGAFEATSDLDGTIKSLTVRYPALKDQTFLVSVNKKIERKNVSLKEGDELALLPPFSGG